jgi:5'-3' exonuclease
MQIHLLDGTYELFRAHFGAPSRLAPSGQEVGATVGLMRSFAALLREPEVTHVAAAFDTVIESFRNQLFDGYKTGEGLEPVLHAQFPLAERACAALGITTWPMVEVEADDALATAAAQLRRAPGVERIYLCSPDKDLAQCVEGDFVVAYDRRKRERMDEQGVVEKFGVPPESIPDFLALVGDKADGIPGVPRWGKKAAATLLARYGHVDRIPAAHEEWDVSVRGAAGLAAQLAALPEEVRLYRKLATWRFDAALAPPATLENLRWRGPDEDALAQLCEELGASVPELPTPAA